MEEQEGGVRRIASLTVEDFAILYLDVFVLCLHNERSDK